MKIGKLKNILIVCALAAVIALSIFAVSIAVSQRDNLSAGADTAAATLGSEYLIGTEVEIPDYSFDVAGGAVTATKTVYFPDGRAFRADKVTPDVMGYYTVEYSADTSEGFKTETKKFYAYSNLYETKGIKSETYYGAHSLTPNNQGLIVSLASAGTFHFNGIIDLSKLTALDKLFSFYVTPEKPGEMDTYTLRFTFTDIYNSDNYLTIIINASRDGIGHGVSYIQAGTNFQPTTGIEANQNKIHRNNIYGFPANFSFYGSDKSGVSNESFLVNNKIEIYFDAASKQLLSKTNSMNNSLIVDFDDPAYFSDLWNDFFTTGEVTMSVSSENTIKTSTNLVFTEIAGYDLTDNKLVDKQDPVVTVNNLGYETLPDAVLNNPYPMFEVTALDQYSGELNATAKVYENYGSPSQIELDVVDNVFVPTHTGKFFAVYSAKDYSDNVGEVKYEINCVAQGNPITLNVSSDREDTGYVGTYIEVAESTATGGNGKINIEIKVADSDGNEVPLENGKFKPMKADIYTVDYIAKDFVSQKKPYTYTVQVSVSDKPVFDSEAMLPKYIISGYEYQLPALTAYDYTAGGAEVTAEVEVTDDDGTRTLGADNKVTFKVNEPGGKRDIRISYKASNGNGTTPVYYDLTAYNVYNSLGRLDMSRYFVGENIISEPAASYVAITAKSGNETADTMFINSLVANGLTTTFEIDPAKSQFGRLNIYLTDSVNPAQQVKFSFRKTMTSAKFSINDGNEYDTDSTFTGSVTEFLINYRDERVSIDNTSFMAINDYLGGGVFEGFSSGKVYMRIEMAEITGESSFRMKNISSQVINNAILDRVGPRIVLNGTYGGMHDIGSTISLPSAIAGDVLDPYVNVTVTVTDPDRKVVTAKDGTNMLAVPADKAYEFEVSSYGVYLVSYYSEDAGGEYTNFTFSVSVLDKEAPVITLSRENVTTAKVGETVVIASATATDNLDAAENITVKQYLVIPGGRVMSVPGNSFVANEAGEYIVRYFAMDSAGNFTIVENVIVVTA